MSIFGKKIENFSEIKNEKSEKTNNFINRIGKIPGMKELIAVLMLSITNPSKAGAEAEKSPINSAQKTTLVKKDVGRVLEFNETTENNNLKLEGDIYDRFSVKEDGELKFNPWAFIAPVQVEAGYETSQKHTATFNVPYEYSRFFNSAEELADKNKLAITKYIEQQLRRELTQTLTFLDVSNNSQAVYEAEHNINLDQLKEQIKHIDIDSIKITGMASPEGPASKGKESLGLGAVDKENLDLATKRAENISPWLQKSLAELGLDNNAITNIDAKEIQFSQDENSKLLEITKKLEINGVDDAEKIFILTQSYNNNDLEDSPDIQKQLNEIIGNKRQVEVTVYMHKQEGKKVIIPLPILLLLLTSLPVLLHKREKNGDQTTEVTKPRETFTDSAVKFTENLDENDYLFVERYKKIDQTFDLDQPILKEKEEATFLDDINRYFDDKTSIERGLDYRQIAIEISQIISHYNNQDSLERAVTHIILTKWKEHDQKARREIDVASNDGLDYHNNDEQIIWARLHAKELIKLAEGYKLNPHELDKSRLNRAQELETQRNQKITV